MPGCIPGRRPLGGRWAVACSPPPGKVEGATHLMQLGRVADFGQGWLPIPTSHHQAGGLFRNLMVSHQGRKEGLQVMGGWEGGATQEEEAPLC